MLSLIKLANILFCFINDKVQYWQKLWKKDLFYAVGRRVNWHSLSGGKFGVLISGPLTQHSSVCAPQGAG